MSLPADVPRDVLGHRVVAPLGVGATARVLLAKTPGGAEVALKRLHTHLRSDPGARARLHAEARALGRAAGDGVVALHDVLDDGVELALVLEHVPGPSLARVLDECRARGAPPAPSDAAAWVRGTLEALARVHDVGLVHGDVGPRNVLTRERRVTLIDFGFAGPASGPGGPLRGTLAYLAPEQADGAATPASDVFAAGVLLWELLRVERYRPATNAAAALAALPTEAPRAIELGRPELAPFGDVTRALLTASPGDRPTARAAAALLSGFG